MTKTKPFQSKLTPHFEEIKQLRQQRKTWKEVSDHIKRVHCIHTSASSCLEFFKRHRKRPAPLGFLGEKIHTPIERVRTPQPQRKAFDWNAVKTSVHSETKSQ